VDPATGRTFGRPDGVNGSFVAEDLRPQKFRDGTEFAPSSQIPDPVLGEAFGRPYPGGESLQRHPTDAGALAAEKDKDAPEEPEDPWRDPSAAAALGTPAEVQPAPAVSSAPVGKLGVRDVLFGGRVSYAALAILAVIALLFGIAGGWVGRKSAEVVEAFTTS
jgi:hypothetical protein